MITHDMLVSDLTCHGMYNTCADYDECRDCCNHRVTEYEDSIRKEAVRKFVECLKDRFSQIVVPGCMSFLLSRKTNSIVDQVLEEYEKEQKIQNYKGMSSDIVNQNGTIVLD